ncbi:MAG: OmpA/MotB family protein [Aureliella sp.]
MAGGGGAWKVAYADFVTAMMAFFMVMWLTSQKPETKQAIEDYFNDPWAKSRLNSNRSRDPSITEIRAGEIDTKKKFQGSNPRLISHDDPESPERKTPRLVTVRAPERTTAGTIIYFSEGSDELTPEALEALKNLKPSLVGLPHKIDIRGHVAQPTAGSKSADDQLWLLSYRRCMRVRKHLEDLGIEPSRLRMSLPGPHEPLVMSTDEKDMLRNGRVEVFLISETADSLQGTPEDRASKVRE